MLGEEETTTIVLLLLADVVVDNVVVVEVVLGIEGGAVSVLLGIKVGFGTAKVPMAGLL